MMLQQQWTGQTGFSNASIADTFKGVFFEDTPEGLTFSPAQLATTKDKCRKDNVYFPEFIENKRAIAEMLFPMNRQLYDFVDGKKEAVPSLGERLQEDEETIAQADVVIIQFFLQPAWMETPALFLMFNAGAKPKYVSTIEVIRLYMNVVKIIEDGLSSVVDQSKYRHAVQEREREISETADFVHMHLFSTAEYQTVFQDLNEETLQCLNQFMVQYTLRFIMVIERFLIRVFDGGFTIANQSLQSNGRVCVAPDETQRASVKESTAIWAKLHEEIFGADKRFSLDTEPTLGYLPPRKQFLEKVEAGDETGAWFSLYTYWLLLATQYVLPE